MSKHSNLVPSYIEAGSPKALRLSMIKTNVKDQAQNRYFDIQTYTDRRGRQKWIAWYYKEVDSRAFIEAASEKE